MLIESRSYIYIYILFLVEQKIYLTIMFKIIHRLPLFWSQFIKNNYLLIFMAFWIYLIYFYKTSFSNEKKALSRFHKIAFTHFIKWHFLIHQISCCKSCMEYSLITAFQLFCSYNTSEFLMVLKYNLVSFWFIHEFDFIGKDINTTSGILIFLLLKCE